jgi:toluene monooxygenase system protein A
MGAWRDLARDLDWEPTYVSERDLFPEDVAGRPWMDHAAWSEWKEPFATTFPEYVRTQSDKEKAVQAVRQAIGVGRDLRGADRAWLSVSKLHSAAFTLAEFAAVVGNLRSARFGRSSAWRATAAFGALDEIRHTQIPLLLHADVVRYDAQFDFTHRLYHTNNWISIAGRHLIDELILASDAVELAIGTNFVFEQGFTNLEFIGLSAVADRVGDHLQRTVLDSIQTDEARHAQIGRATLERVVTADKAYAQRLVDKWFWRSWRLFSTVTGIAMDYLTPVSRRGPSFKEFVLEWVAEQFLAAIADVGLERPWYWDDFVQSASHDHHMMYASAYTYRSTVWFDMVVPGPADRAWLRSRYPESWDLYEPIWTRIAEKWRATDPGVELAVHGAAIPTFCNLCQLVLAHGTPTQNGATSLDWGPPGEKKEKFVFCSPVCRWIFEQEPERYAASPDVVRRVLAGKAPGNLVEFLTRYSGLRYEVWGKDAKGGDYEWLDRPGRPGTKGAR